ncbi:MAG: glycogen/starch synthase [Chloroflexota bacterium]
MTKKKTLRIAMPAWEIGRASSGLGAKVGGLGVIIEELPPELTNVAQQDTDLPPLEIEILSPCFAHYDKAQLTPLKQTIPVTIDEQPFLFDLYKHKFPDGQTVIYFWNEAFLSWTNGKSIYPNDPEFALRLYAATAQAMAGYIATQRFNTIHLHDYHVGLIPFYLDDAYLQKTPIHFTIHNATYQGVVPFSPGQGYDLLAQLNLSGEAYFHYFDHFDRINMMKGCMLRVHEKGGKITTVSGDIAGSWGYAAELKQSDTEVWQKAYAQKGGPPAEIFLPNQYLDLFEKLPIAGITNGMSDRNRAENLPELKADVLQQQQEKQGADQPIFSHPDVQAEMLDQDHTFDVKNLQVKAQLKRLLHLEAFGSEPNWDTILMTAVGRLVEQKNLGLVADIIERTLAADQGTKFIILASAPEGDPAGQATEMHFFRLAHIYPSQVYFNNSFNLPLSKLIFAGGDFSLIPSRFEPCGLVDYESSLLGNVVIGRATGGLTKVRDFAYLYEWLDTHDRTGEANAFFDQIQQAIHTYRYNPPEHGRLIRAAMMVDTSWGPSAKQYVNMYRYGLLIKKWQAERQKLLNRFVKNLDTDIDLFNEFFISGEQEYSDAYDWALKASLTNLL